MIVPMLKYSFIVYHLEYEAFLKELKQLGMLHIEVKEPEPTPEIQELARSLNDISKTIRSLEDRTKDKKVKGFETRFESGEEVLQRIKELESSIEQLHQKRSAMEKEVNQLAHWGNFSPVLLRQLKEESIHVRFFICRSKNYDARWEAQQCIIPISEHSGYTYFVLIEKKDEQKTEDPNLEGADEISVPAESLIKVQENIEILKSQTKELNQELDLIAFNNLAQLREYGKSIASQLDDSQAKHQTNQEAEEHVMIIHGWVPKPRQKELDAFLDKNHILNVVKDTKDEEKVPVLLKNNRFARVFETIGELYELPNHRELDLVPFFAPFYMMFFGFSLGDAGYGLIILLAAFWLKFKMPELKKILTLAQWLGLATVIFGALTGTFFGMDLINSDIAWLEDIKKYMIDTDKLFNLALILGAIQILFGMTLKVVNISIRKGFSYAYSTVGWLLLIIGSAIVYLLKNTEAINESVSGYVQNGLLIVSGALILLFNNPKQNIFKNFLSGLWDVYSMATGLIGDLLSYIRLFALGVSSAILGFVFNELAMSLKPDIIIIGPIVMIIILVLGHGMTLFMAGLGAFVHPIRLTFVEFYKNAGFTGGGKRYTPFAEKNLK